MIKSYILNKSCEIVKLTDHINAVHELGIAWQVETNKIIDYGESYWSHYVNLEHTKMAVKLNKFRCSLVESYCQGVILDIGIGSGEFIKKVRLPAYGYDVNKIAVDWLKSREIYFDVYNQDLSNPINDDKICGITLFDVLEHIPDMSILFGKIPNGVYVFISIPIFSNLNDIIGSKHNKPGEHLYYFTSNGLCEYLSSNGLDLISMSDMETSIGRDNIKTFIFRKNKL